jgi:hypothetical protein
VSSVPFDALLEGVFADPTNTKSSKNYATLLSIAKVVRVLRLERIISTMTATDDVKLVFKLMKLCVLIFIYIHLTTCLWYWIAVTNKDNGGTAWKPLYYAHNGIAEKDFFDRDVTHTFAVSIYSGVL